MIAGLTAQEEARRAHAYPPETVPFAVPQASLALLQVFAALERRARIGWRFC